ncbi:MAG: DUF3656 domain-containing protein [bacterium]|nr:DUF3656 domain-containing protein [bacterium]
MKAHTIELLSPAGSRESFIAAIGAGADAVYVGGSRYGARAYAKNFTEEELLWAIDYAHLFGKKVYMTVNTLMKEQELHDLTAFLEPYYDAGLDAVIVQDLGAISVIRNCFPKLDIHASTQMAITSAEGVLLLEELGIRQVVPARELSLAEIKTISEKTSASIECFVHGAICYSYSGKCLFSSLIGGRSGNRGRCAQPCRLPYEAVSGGRKQNQEQEQYLLSLKDMCTIKMIPELIQAGITSFKIEGRMKRPEYVAGVTRIYRKYIDRFMELKTDQKYCVEKNDYDELTKLYTRSGHSDGYYRKKNGRDMLTLQKPSYETDEDERFHELYEIYVDHMKKISAKAVITLRKNMPSCLELQSGEYSVKVYGDMVQEALSRPLDQEAILKQLHKTGNSDIDLGQIRVDRDDDIFMPVKQLNELRRQGITALTEEMLRHYHRSKASELLNPEAAKVYTGVEQENDNNTMVLSAYVETMETLKSLCKTEGLHRLYISSADITRTDEAVAAAYRSGKEVYIALPVICRHYDQEKIKALMTLISRKEISGVSVQNYEWLYLLQQYGYQGDIVADYYLYTMNEAAKKQLRSFGCRHFTIPLELNEKEIRHMENSSSELLVYGYLPMMVTAQCLRNTLTGCTHIPENNLGLKDRYQKHLQVKNCCSECYNVIYNSVPLSLHSELTKIKKMGFHGLRLNFTGESAEEAARITEWYTEAINHVSPQVSALPFQDYTKGHFSRGVE